MFDPVRGRVWQGPRVETNTHADRDALWGKLAVCAKASFVYGQTGINHLSRNCDQVRCAAAHSPSLGSLCSWPWAQCFLRVTLTSAGTTVSSPQCYIPHTTTPTTMSLPSVSLLCLAPRIHGRLHPVGSILQQASVWLSSCRVLQC